MKSILLPVGTAALVLSGAALAQTADDALGVWLNTANKATIEFYKCGDNLCGKLLKVADGQKVDNKNPDPAKRGRPIEGLVFMDNLKSAGPNKWTGLSYNRADGKSYPATLTVKAKDALDLTACSAPKRCATYRLTQGAATPDAQACSGPTKTAKARSGKMLTLCLDGKYSTCLRDSQRLGNSFASAKAFCDSRKAGGFVK